MDKTKVSEVQAFLGDLTLMFQQSSQERKITYKEARKNKKINEVKKKGRGLHTDTLQVMFQVTMNIFQIYLIIT